MGDGPVIGEISGPRNPDKLALGLDRYLDRFAARHQARTWKELVRADPDEWRYEFLALMDEATTEVYFNLREVEVGTGLLRAASGNGSNTDWELLMIREHPGWWPRVRWMDEDRPVANPFDDPESGV